MIMQNKQMICIFATPRNLAVPYHLKIFPILAIQIPYTHIPIK